MTSRGRPSLKRVHSIDVDARSAADGQPEALAGANDAARERARLPLEAYERAQQWEVLSEVGRIVNATHELPAMLRAVAHQLERIIPYRRINVAFYEPATNEIVQHHIAAGQTDQIRAPMRLPAQNTISWRVMQGRRTQIVPDTRASDVPRMRELEREGVLYVVSLPMLREGRCLGVLNVDSGQPRAFSDAQVAFLELLADHLAIAVDNARLFHELEHELAERERTETALRDSEARYRQIIEVSNEGIWMIDADGTIVFANARVSRMLGYSVDELVGSNVGEFIVVEDRAVVAEKLAARRSGRSDRYDLRLRHKDGSTRWVLISASPFFDEAQQFVGAVSMFTDITDQRRAEAELRQAQKLESVGRLAAGIAHEINTPIQFVGDNTHFLRDCFSSLTDLIGRYRALCEAAERSHVDDALLAQIREAEAAADLDYLAEEVPRAVEQTLDGVQRVATIVQAMKDFAHTRLPGMAPADVNRGLLSTLTVAANELKYVADVETDLADLPPVVCRLDELNQVFINLLVNAAHAIADVHAQTGQRGIIRVTTRQQGADVIVTIADTGAGIPDEIQDKVFEQFFTTKEVGRGTGQGLPLARSVVEKHGGSLTFESEVGRGTTFSVRIPIDGGSSHRSGETA